MISYRLLSIVTAAVSIVLSAVLLVYPQLIFDLFGLDGETAAYVIARRASMLFIGYAVIAYLFRNAGPSEGRRRVSLGIASAMFGLAVLGTFEFLRGSVGMGIFLAVGGEIALAALYFSVWMSGGGLVE